MLRGLLALVGWTQPAIGKGESSFKSTPTQKRKDVPQWSGIQGFHRDCGDSSLHISVQLRLCRQSFGFQR